MGKFNTYGSTITTTTNHQGGEGIVLSSEAQLIKLALTAMVENTYYEKSNDLIDRADKLVASMKGSEFPLQLAVFSRDKGLRSINHLLTALYVKHNRGSLGLRGKLLNALSGVDGYKRGIVWRPDELGEILGAYMKVTQQKKVPNSIKEVYGKILSGDKFDAYQYSKYKTKGFVKLHDLVNYTHAKGENASMIIQGNYLDIDTFEKVSSQAKGDTTERKAKVEKMMKSKDSGQLGDKALLLNLGNMMEDGISIDDIVKQIKSRKFKGIMPYEFIRSAWFAHKRGMNQLLVETLFDKAVEAFGELPVKGKTAVLVDTSGSMHSRMSDNSDLMMVELGAFYGAIAQRLGGDLIAWASTAEKVEIFPGDGCLRVIDQTLKVRNGMGTQLQTALNMVKDSYDNVIVFSDMQIMRCINNTGKLKKIFCFDLSAYQHGISIKDNIIHFSGFDDTMLKLGADLVDPSRLIKVVKDINL